MRKCSLLGAFAILFALIGSPVLAQKTEGSLGPGSHYGLEPSARFCHHGYSYRQSYYPSTYSEAYYPAYGDGYYPTYDQGYYGFDPFGAAADVVGVPWRPPARSRRRHSERSMLWRKAAAIVRSATVRRIRPQEPSWDMMAASTLAGRLHLGGTAVVELTGIRTPCRQIDRFQRGLRQVMLRTETIGPKYRCGVFGVVLTRGRVSPGDLAIAEVPAGPCYPLPAL
jgi:hypothetical protein